MFSAVGSPVGFVLLIKRLQVTQKPFEGITCSCFFSVMRVTFDVNCSGIYSSYCYIVVNVFSRT